MYAIMYIPRLGSFFLRPKEEESYPKEITCGEECFDYRRYQMRVKITLACTECKQRNYDSMKNKKNNPERLEMRKYCRFCRKHTEHKETK